MITLLLYFVALCVFLPQLLGVLSVVFTWLFDGVLKCE